MTSLTAPVIALLDRRFIASMGTINSDGTVHLVAIWYMLRGDQLLIPTGSSSRKADNIRRTAYASLMIDERSNHSMSGVVIKGLATVIEGVAALTINREIHNRYLSVEALADPHVHSIFEADDVTLAIQCDTVTSWDMASSIPEIFGDNGYMLPVDN